MDSGVFPLPDDFVPECDRLPAHTQVQRPHFSSSLPLKIEEVLWIVDRLVACEVSRGMDVVNADEALELTTTNTMASAGSLS